MTQIELHFDCGDRSHVAIKRDDTVGGGGWQNPIQYPLRSAELRAAEPSFDTARLFAQLSPVKALSGYPAIRGARAGMFTVASRRHPSGAGTAPYYDFYLDSDVNWVVPVTQGRRYPGLVRTYDFDTEVGVGIRLGQWYYPLITDLFGLTQLGTSWVKGRHDPHRTHDPPKIELNFASLQILGTHRPSTLMHKLHGKAWSVPTSAVG